jgi:hypothetical protein
MADQAIEIRIPNLTRLDQLELSRTLGDNGVRFEAAQGTGDTHGELATLTAAVIISLASLRVLAVWLAKKHDRRTFKATFDVVNRDGSRRAVTVESSSASTEAPDAQVLKQLAAVCNVDLSQLRKL